MKTSEYQQFRIIIFVDKSPSPKCFIIFLMDLHSTTDSEEGVFALEYNPDSICHLFSGPIMDSYQSNSNSCLDNSNPKWSTQKDMLNESESPTFNITSPGCQTDSTSSTLTKSSKISSKNVSADNSVDNSQFEPGFPCIVLTSKDNSFPFTKRKICLEKPVKVGRAIGRLRPSANNAIFDCKVLSRNHAMLWFQNGKFLLKDTGSSNGTFVNNVRLTSGNEKAESHELLSGDLVKFGVEVVEKHNVHNCIVATIALFGHDGVELKNSSLSTAKNENDSLNNLNSSITASQLIELSFFINDAICKQTLLENQLDSMKNVMNKALQSAKQSWSSMIDEDMLLSRIETLQSKLGTLILSNKDVPTDAAVETMKQEMMEIISDKEKFEQTSKLSLQKCLDEKTATLSNLNFVELELKTKTSECDQLRTTVNRNVEEMKYLVEDCDKIKSEREELSNNLEALKQKHCKTEQEFENERSVLNEKILLLQQSECEMKSKVAKLENSIVKTISDSYTQTVPFRNSNEISTQIDFDYGECSKQLQQTAISACSYDSTCFSCQQMKSLLVQSESKLNASQIELLSFNSQIKAILEYVLLTHGKSASILNIQERKINDLIIQVNAFSEYFKQNRKTDSEKINLLLENIVHLKAKNNALKEIVEARDSDVSKNNEEIEKYKCDIEVLNCQLEKLTGDESTRTNTDSVVSFQDRFAQTDSYLENQENFYLQKVLNRLHTFDSADPMPFGTEEPCEILFKMIMKRLDRVLENTSSLSLKNSELRTELNLVKERFNWLSYQNELSFCMAILPLLFIFIAIVLAFYPILSFIMATFER